jgi:small-conductance mechanosensitive channel
MTSIYDYVPAEFRQLAVVGVILAITVIVNWVAHVAVRRASLSKLARDSLDTTILNFAQRLITVVIYGTGIGASLTHIPELKIVGHSLLTGAGILTVVGGLASQQVLGNIVSGFMIIFFRPFRIGDKITLSGNYTGIVEDITLRETIIRDFENNRVIIPNSQISSQVIINTNHTDNRVCTFIEVGVGYSSDLNLAMTIMTEEISGHPLLIDQRTEEQKRDSIPVVVVRLTSLGDSAITLKAWAWAENSGNGFILQCDSYANIKRRFDQAGIDIPFPQTTISFAENASVQIMRNKTLIDDASKDET